MGWRTKALVQSTLSGIHFLRYSDAQWRRFGRNRFAHVKRLREDDDLRLFDECGQEIRAPLAMASCHFTP